MTRLLIELSTLSCLTHLASGATYYIDPQADAETANGSQEHPWVSWGEVPIESGNSYLQKRGTECETGQLVLAPDVSLGAYGDGAQPQITITAEAPDKGITALRAEGIVIRNLDVAAPNAVSAFCFTECKDVLIEDCIARTSQWGIRILGGCEDVRILDTIVYDIQDDGIFLQWTKGIEIARCTVYNVNTNFEFPYTSDKEAGGDGIQFSNCDDWHVHHNIIDRTNSGNKFCFISNDEQTHGVLEYNWLRGPLAAGDGGASVYLGYGGSGVTVRHNLIEGQAPTGIWHHTAGLEVYGNAFIGHPTGIHSHGPEPVSIIRENLLFGLGQVVVGDHFELAANLSVPPEEGASSRLLMFGTRTDVPDAVSELMALIVDGEDTGRPDGYRLAGSVVPGGELTVTYGQEREVARLHLGEGAEWGERATMAEIAMIEVIGGPLGAEDDNPFAGASRGAIWSNGTWLAVALQGPR